MPPPSPALEKRKEQLLELKRREKSARESAAIPRSDAQLTRRGSATSPSSSYSEQFVRRRKSQMGLDADGQKSSPNGLQAPWRTAQRSRRRSGELRGDPESTAAQASESEQWDAEQGTNFGSVNGWSEDISAVGALAADTPVAEEGADEETVVNGHGGVLGTTIFDGDNMQEEPVKVVDSAVPRTSKKRKAPGCGSTMAVAITAGAMGVSGIALCRMYPASPAAALIRLSLVRMRDCLRPILQEIWDVAVLLATNVGSAMGSNWLMILRGNVLEEFAAALESLINTDFARWRAEGMMTLPSATISIEKLRLQLISLVSAVADKLSSVITMGLSRLKKVCEAESDGTTGLLERLQSVLVEDLAVFAAALSRAASWLQFQVDAVLDVIGFEPTATINHVDESSAEFISSLQADQAAVNRLQKHLVSLEAKSLQDVKQYEQLRLEVAAATDSILAGTREGVLESVAEAKRAALEHVASLKIQLVDEYLTSIEVELQAFEQTLQLVKETGDRELMEEVVSETEEHLDAALKLKMRLIQSKYPPTKEPLDSQTAAELSPTRDIRDGVSEILADLDELIVDVEHKLADIDAFSASMALEQDQEEDSVMQEVEEQPDGLDTTDGKDIERPDETPLQPDVDLSPISSPDVDIATEQDSHIDSLRSRNEGVIDENEPRGSEDLATLDAEPHADGHVSEVDSVTSEDQVAQDIVSAIQEVEVMVEASAQAIESALESTEQTRAALAEAEVQASTSDGAAPEDTGAQEITSILEEVEDMVETSEQALTSVLESAEEARAASPDSEVAEDGNVVETDVHDATAQENELKLEDKEQALAEEELRVIAAEEGIHLQIVEHDRNSELTLDIKAVKVTEEVVPDIAATASTDSPIVDQGGNALLQIGLVSGAFLVVAGLAAYFLGRHRRRMLAAQRRKRWRRLADMEEEAEEVVLLSDSSDEEVDADDVSFAKDDVNGGETTVPSDDAEPAEVSGGEDADVETSEEYDDEEEKGLAEVVEEKEDIDDAETESERSEPAQVVNNEKETPDTVHSDGSPIDTSDAHLTYPSAHANNKPVEEDTMNDSDDIAHRTRGRLRKTVA